jgi:hypothetical protein
MNRSKVEGDFPKTPIPLFANGFGNVNYLQGYLTAPDSTSSTLATNNGLLLRPPLEF